MNSQQRRNAIMQQIRDHSSAKVGQLVRRFNVSAVTIRHDLKLLEQQGCLFRCYGGATLNPNFAFDQPVQQKGRLNKDRKELIAKAAAELVLDGEHIILDSGSTIGQMPRYLSRLSRITVMTNALDTAYQLSRSANVDLYVAGGNLRRASCSLIGIHGEHQVSDHRFDKLFLGVDGFDLEAGITTPDQGEARVNRAMCHSANQVIAVTDSSKFGRKSFCTIRAAREIDILVTDPGLPNHYHDALTEMGVRVIIANMD